MYLELAESNADLERLSESRAPIGLSQISQERSLSTGADARRGLDVYGVLGYLDGCSP